ncbi:MAG: hypothetical protein MJA30_19875 [Cytophagales bacterium]|nr:hypothetical protein [Cytophagales bacterium]
MENQSLDTKKEIKLKRALILGNFYQQKVKIISAINQGYETIVGTVIGLNKDAVLTKEGLKIPKNSIKMICHL